MSAIQTSVYCIVPSRKEANAVVSRMRSDGFSEEELIVADEPPEVDGLLQSHSAFKQSMIRGVTIGAAAGVVVSALELLNIVVPSPQVWNAMPIVVFNAIGWGLYGMIVGGTGILARRHVPEDVARRFEERVENANVLLAVKVRDAAMLPSVTAKLAASGATDIETF